MEQEWGCHPGDFSAFVHIPQTEDAPIVCRSNSSKFAKMKSSSSDELSIFSGRVTIKCSMPPDIFERIADEFFLSGIYCANILLMERN